MSEVAKLHRDNLASEDGYVVIRLSGKGGRVTHTVLSPDAEKIIRAHRAKVKGASGYLFLAMARNGHYQKSLGRDPRTRPISTRSVLMMLKSYARKAGLDPKVIRPHGGRVFFVTEAYRRTHDLEGIAHAVGHANLGSTRKYLRYVAEHKDHAALSVLLTPRENLVTPPKRRKK